MRRSRQQRRAQEKPFKKSCKGTVASGTALALGVLATGGAAEAATFMVTSLDDSGPGSLRQAILEANAGAGADVITFQGGLTGTVTLTSGELQITDSVDIQGPGPAALSVSGINASGVFYVHSPHILIEVTISGLTITGGNAGAGGGIFNFDEHLTLDNLAVTGNTASLSGGGVAFNGEIGTLIIRDSVISGNAADQGAGLSAYGTGPVQIRNTIISDNVAADRGGGLSFVRQTGHAIIESSTISGNSAGTWGGGILALASLGGLVLRDTTVSGNTAATGGGLALSYASTAIENSTISGNQATDGPGGGIFLYGQYDRFLALRHATVAGNTSAASGGGIYVDGEGTLVNSLVADNSAASNNDLANDADGAFNISFSLIENPGTANINDDGGNILNQDPQLGPLQNNGGPTQTHLPAATSPAVDAGNNAASLATDQRGVARPVGTAVDMGAVEVEAVAGLADIPTLGDMGRLLFAGLAGRAGYLKLRRRKEE